MRPKNTTSIHLEKETVTRMFRIDSKQTLKRRKNNIHHQIVDPDIETNVPMTMFNGGGKKKKLSHGNSGRAQTGLSSKAALLLAPSGSDPPPSLRAAAQPVQRGFLMTKYGNGPSAPHIYMNQSQQSMNINKKQWD